MLMPGAYAYRPLVNTLHLTRQEVPVAIIYGSPEEDWMRPMHGEKLVLVLRQQGIRCELRTIPHAGHQVFMDNPLGFNEVFIELYHQLTSQTNGNNGNNTRAASSSSSGGTNSSSIGRGGKEKYTPSPPRLGNGGGGSSTDYGSFVID